MAQLEKLLEESRRELLDLSTRNRLLAIPVESKSARVIHVRDEKSDVVFRLLVEERKAMGVPAARACSAPRRSRSRSSNGLLRDNDEPPTGQIVSPPCRLHIGQRDSFDIHVQLAARSERPKPRKSIEDDAMWNTASTSPALP